MTVISIDGHPREEELVAYVADALALTEAEVERLEAHVFACAVCARRLQRAASFQVVLHEAAAELELEARATPPLQSSPSWLRRHGGAVSALWASAAAVLLLVAQPGAVTPPTEPAPPTTQAAAVEPSSVDPSVTGCDPSDPRCADGLLASVDPLQSVDPLSSWPDDPFSTSADWAEGAPTQGEPCGSGEDGGPLVCQPFSG